MGLIREIQGVNATIDKRERARREREQLKILQENYIKEIEGNLQAEFSALFRKNDFDIAYKMAVFEKDAIIEKIYNIVSKITYTENNKKYYTYSNFDIITDVENKYYKILNKIKNEIQIQDKILKIELLERLENKLTRLFEISNNKYCASIIASEKDMKMKIIQELGQNEKELQTLKINYNKILKKVIQLYDGNIKLEKMEIQRKKDIAKTKQNKKIFNQIATGFILKEINKILPKGFSKGKGR